MYLKLRVSSGFLINTSRNERDIGWSTTATNARFAQDRTVSAVVPGLNLCTCADTIRPIGEYQTSYQSVIRGMTMTMEEAELVPEVIDLTVNGRPRQAHRRLYPRLLQVLREELGLTGTKYGCGEGLCGACTVLIDGKAGRAGRERQPARSATSVHRRGRDAVRLLLPRNDHERCGAAAGESASGEKRDNRKNGGQYLPVQQL